MARGVQSVKSLVSLDIALSLHEVSMHLRSAFTLSQQFENFNSFSAFQNFM